MLPATTKGCYCSWRDRRPRTTPAGRVGGEMIIDLVGPGEMFAESVFLENPRFHVSCAALAAIQTCADRNLSALVITDTELKLIAAAAIIGDSSRPKAG